MRKAFVSSTRPNCAVCAAYLQVGWLQFTEFAILQFTSRPTTTRARLVRIQSSSGWENQGKPGGRTF